MGRKSKDYKKLFNEAVERGATSKELIDILLGKQNRRAPLPHKPKGYQKIKKGQKHNVEVPPMFRPKKRREGEEYPMGWYWTTALKALEQKREHAQQELEKAQERLRTTQHTDATALSNLNNDVKRCFQQVQKYDNAIERIQRTKGGEWLVPLDYLCYYIGISKTTGDLWVKKGWLVADAVVERNKRGGFKRLFHIRDFKLKDKKKKLKEARQRQGRYTRKIKRVRNVWQEKRGE